MTNVNVLTQEVAARILNARIITNESGRVENVVVTNVSAPDFMWENTGDSYAILNTNLMNNYLAQEAMELFEDEKYQDACNKGLSVRITPEQANEISKGDYIKLQLQEVELKDGTTALMIKTGSVALMPAVKVKKFSFVKKEADELIKDFEKEVEIEDVVLA